MNNVLLLLEGHDSNELFEKTYDFKSPEDVKKAIIDFYKRNKGDPLVKDTLEAFMKGDKAGYEKNLKSWYSIRMGSVSIKEWEAIKKAAEKFKKNESVSFDELDEQNKFDDLNPDPKSWEKVYSGDGLKKVSPHTGGLVPGTGTEFKGFPYMKIEGDWTSAWWKFAGDEKRRGDIRKIVKSVYSDGYGFYLVTDKKLNDRDLREMLDEGAIYFSIGPYPFNSQGEKLFAYAGVVGL